MMHAHSGAAAFLLASFAIATFAAENTLDRSEAARNRPNEVQPDDAVSARRQIDDATQLVQRMRRDPGLSQLLQQASGVFIATDYLKAAAILGTRGGQGVLLLRRESAWSDPVFYNFGRVSIGAQAGATAGSIVMFLMSPKAVDLFRKQGEQEELSLNANAGLTVLDYSAIARGAPARGDVIVWSDADGLFAGVSVGVGEIRIDATENQAHYGGQVTPQDIFGGTVTSPLAQPLRSALGQPASGNPRSAR